jgi:hypothetical protein
MFIALLILGLLSKPNRTQHYCFNTTETIANAMFPRTQAYCFNTAALCTTNHDRVAAHNNEVSSCQRTTELYCINASGVRWCSTDQYLCNETAQYFGIDHSCTVSTNFRNQALP